MALTVCSDLAPAAWLTAATSENLVDLGPPGFAAYARLRFLPDPAFAGQNENDAVAREDGPPESEQIGAALQVLARHTATPDDCYFCLWDGWGWDVRAAPGGWTLHKDLLTIGPDDSPAVSGPPPPGAVPAALDRLVRPDRSAAPEMPSTAPKLVLPHRAYYLFRGSLTDLGDWGLRRAGSFPGIDLPDPAFIWPADRSWCLANDVDPHWAGIGASVVAVEQLLAVPMLDVVVTDPTRAQPYYY